MIEKGYLLIHSDGVPWEPCETVLGFSENKEELEKEAETFNKEREESLVRFQFVSEQISSYEEKFYEFRSKFPKFSKEDFQEWLIENPIPQEIAEFVDFHEYEDGEIFLRTTEEHELNDCLLVQSFGNPP